MALSAPSILTSGTSTSPSNPHSTASISPTANTPGIIVVCGSRNPATTVSVAAGSGLDLGTITPITDVQYGTIASPSRRLYAWWYSGSASPGSGVVSISFGATPNGAGWIVLEMAGMDTTSPIVSSATNRADSSTGITVTLSTAGDGTLGFFANGDSANSITIGGSFTNIGQLTCASSNSFKLRGEYALSGLTSVDCTQSSTHLGGIGIAIAAAASSLTLTPTGSENTAQSGTPGMTGVIAATGSGVNVEDGTASVPNNLNPSGSDLTVESPDYDTATVFELLPDGSEITEESGTAGLSFILIPTGSGLSVESGIPSLPGAIVVTGSEVTVATGAPGMLGIIIPSSSEVAIESGTAIADIIGGGLVVTPLGSELTLSAGSILAVFFRPAGPVVPAFVTKVPQFGAARPSTYGNSDTLILCNGTWRFDSTYKYGDNE